jgi:hypothetical protein
MPRPSLLHLVALLVPFTPRTSVNRPYIYALSFRAQPSSALPCSVIIIIIIIIIILPVPRLFVLNFLNRMFREQLVLVLCIQIHLPKTIKLSFHII